jgi:hypothetical protein
MWKFFAAGGSMAHIAAGTWSLMSAAAQAEPAVWVSAGLQALGPGLLGLAVAVVACMVSSPPKVFSIEQNR